MTHRYPGPRSFTGDDRHLFFGRDVEKQELFRLIVLNDLVVLFGESGTGKTSLLQAGVCPVLEEQQYKPVFIRLNNTEEAPELQVCHQLKEGGFIPADMPEDRTLWEYFSRFWYVDLGEVYTPVIVFDQFEELFTLYQPEQRAAFIEQFAAIANRRPPMGQLGEALPAPQVKFVFSLRSDFLYLLDELSADIPAILRCRFQLRLLDRERASDAITRPAAMAGGYISPIFGFSPAALEGILSALGRVSEGNSEAVTSMHRLTTEIAAFQLQLVCRQLEEKIIRQKQPAGFQITPEFYGNTQGIRQIIEDFYHKVLEKTAPEVREAVEKLLARGLIRNGRRIMMEASAMRDEYGVPQASLELLHDKRLLKREARKGEIYYEISHDTLVKPILERFKKIEESERESEAERLRVQAEDEKRRANEAERLKNEAITAQKVAEEQRFKAEEMMALANTLKVKAEKQALTAYANDLAYKSITALRDGDRNTAIRLTEFAHRYVEADNPNVTRALLEALYYNDIPDPTRPFLPQVATLEGHHDAIISVAFSPDGKRLATGSLDNTVRIWDLELGKELVILVGHTDAISSVAFSPSGKRLASGSFDKTAKIWDLESPQLSGLGGKELTTLEGHSSSVISVAFSPDGKRLATGSGDNTAKIWDLDSPVELCQFNLLITLDGHFATVWSVAFSPDGKKLATGSGDNTAKIWDLGSRNVLVILEGHNGDVWSVAFSPDGKRLATGSGDNTAKIWDVESIHATGQCAKALITLEGHSYPVRSIAFSPDGRLLATGSFDKTAKIWDLDSSKMLTRLVSHCGTVLSVTFSPDSKLLATGSFDKTAKIWDLGWGEALTVLEDHSFYIHNVAFSPDGKRLASGSFDKTAKIWDLKSGMLLTTFEGHTGDVVSFAFSPDGKMLATGSDDETAKIWDLESGKALTTFVGHTNRVLSVAFSSDGKRLATGSDDKTLKIWDLESGKAVTTFSDHTSSILSIAFLPDRKRLAAGFADNTAKVWDLESGMALTTFTGDSKSVLSVAFSPDGKRLATGSWENTVKIWDLESGRAITALNGHTSYVRSVAFSFDGKQLVSGSNDKTAKIWDLESGKVLATLSGHKASVLNVTFSPNGKRLATCSEDKTAKIWDITADGWLGSPKGRGVKFAGVAAEQLAVFSLEKLLDQHPNNEQKLIATREVWQIKAFADLAASHAGGSNILSKVEPIYARADRLYGASLALQDEPLIRMDYAKMLRRWAAVCESEGQMDKAGELATKADGLWKGENQD